ncbi:hypothetical protein [Rhizobium terrae]|uniref:hypothetical protein n=1 Tax=Rhizobium terrae TaxID=2171756 RepID=UPI0021F8B402|nr:hypothetical protein [Rhizobium terrae]
MRACWTRLTDCWPPLRKAVALFTRSASDQVIAKLLKGHRDIADAVSGGNDSHELEVHAQAVDWGMHDAFIDALGNTIIRMPTGSTRSRCG